jgi:hypothetical protein
MRLTRMFLSLTFCAAAVIGAVSAADQAPIVREEKTVMVDGKPEVWRLEWKGKPTPVCGVDDPAALTCPCTGFAYGERGSLALVRIRSGGQSERLELGSLFNDRDFPLNAGGEQAALQRWSPQYEGDQSDFKHIGDEDFAAKVATRPVLDVMRMGDYIHEGQATQFLLQVDTAPCGKRQMVLLGTSKEDPHLHMFVSAEDPKSALTLGSWEWEALLKNRNPVDVIDWNCGDHGSDQQLRVHLSVNAGVIRVTRSSRQCPVEVP